MVAFGLYKHHSFTVFSIPFSNDLHIRLVYEYFGLSDSNAYPR